MALLSIIVLIFLYFLIKEAARKREMESTDICFNRTPIESTSNNHHRSDGHISEISNLNSSGRRADEVIELENSRCQAILMQQLITENALLRAQLENILLQSEPPSSSSASSDSHILASRRHSPVASSTRHVDLESGDLPPSYNDCFENLT